MERCCCLNCQCFCFWNGDYCCIHNMEIHQYGVNNDIWMNEDIDNTMRTPNNCDGYEYKSHPEFEEEYDKYQEYKKMQDDYYKFVK